jgi:hypothetical protein
MRLLSSGSLTSDQSSFWGFCLELDFELDLELEDLLSRCFSDRRSDISVSVFDPDSEGDLDGGRLLGELTTMPGGPLSSMG